MKKTRFQCMQERVKEKFDDEQGKRIVSSMEEEYDNLCKDLSGKSDPMENHKKNNIFPVVTAFHALIKEGFDRDRAAEISNDCFLEIMEDIADSIRKMMKFPGAYKLMPFIWKKAMPKLFSEKSGFKFRFYDSDRNQVKFDMTACPYFQICKDMDCIELAPVFCNTDDVCYGNMHPKLIWNRTKTMAKNGDVCDFDLYIKK